jgi:hypothetical protein
MIGECDSLCKPIPIADESKSPELFPDGVTVLPKQPGEDVGTVA